MLSCSFVCSDGASGCLVDVEHLPLIIMSELREPGGQVDGIHACMYARILFTALDLWEQQVCVCLKVQRGTVDSKHSHVIL